MSEIEIRKKHNAQIILGILLDGHPVLVNGEEYLLQDGVFGVRRQVYENGVRKDDRIIGVDMTVSGFIKWCEMMPEEMITQAVFSHVAALQKRRRPS